MTLKIGTRKSPLAMAQAYEVKDRLVHAWPQLEGQIELVPMQTSGDRFSKENLADLGGKGLFTKEIEEALLAGSIDMAVHSMKDMPTVLPPGLMIGAMPQREDARDKVIVATPGLRSLRDLSRGITFGTASLRRAAQLKLILPDLNIVPLRGNVQTRLRKLEEGEIVATMLAVAGLNRLGLTNINGVILQPEEFLPAIGQGAIGIECREDDRRMRDYLAPLSHADTETAVVCERAMLRELDGSCHTPIAGYAQVSGEKLWLRGLWIEGGVCERIDITGDAGKAEQLGREAGQQLRARLKA